MRYGLPKKILVPTDLSDSSDAALKEAAALAEKCDAELIVLYADELTPPLDPSIEVPQKFVDMTDVQRTAVVEEQLRKRVATIVPPGVHVDSMVRLNVPVDAILNVAEERDADWIVMATHGRTGMKRAFQGSVTEEVMRHTKRPVLAIHGQA